MTGTENMDGVEMLHEERGGILQPRQVFLLVGLLIVVGMLGFGGHAVFRNPKRQRHDAMQAD
jgi:hypothetical protein